MRRGRRRSPSLSKRAAHLAKRSWSEAVIFAVPFGIRGNRARLPVHDEERRRRGNGPVSRPGSRLRHARRHRGRVRRSPVGTPINAVEAVIGVGEARRQGGPSLPASLPLSALSGTHYSGSVSAGSPTHG